MDKVYSNWFNKAPADGKRMRFSTRSYTIQQAVHGAGVLALVVSTMSFQPTMAEDNHPPMALPGSSNGQHAHHGLRQVPAGPEPQVKLVVTPDEVDGYNVFLRVKRFRFSPKQTGKHSDKFEGHAHLFVNGQKKMRLYGPWFHVPNAWLQPGKNVVVVTLNDNRHAQWATEDGEIAIQTELINGLFDGIEIEHHLVGEIPTFQVPEGADVRLSLFAPDPVQLHLHAYDILAEAGPQVPAVIAFRADHTGRFAIVVHDGNDLLGRKERAVAYVEVRHR